MELFEVIRRGYGAGGAIQGLSKKHGVGGSVPALPGACAAFPYTGGSELRLAPVATGKSEAVPGRDLPTVDQRLSRRT